LKRLLPFTRQARIAGAVVPPGLKFRFVLAVSRLQGRVMGWFGSNPALTEAAMRDEWLHELTLHGGFPIPWRLHGRDVLDHYKNSPVLYYTMHLPLCEIPLRVVVELGYPVPVFLADPGRIVDQDKLVVPGLETRTRSLPSTDSPLVRMRTLLQRQQSVGCLADRYFAGDFHVNPLRLAGRLGVPVIFPFAELGPDGVVEVTFQPLPYPLCETEEEIEHNVSFLREIRDRILRSLGVSAGAHEVFEMPLGKPGAVLQEIQKARSA
jgi:hypothetical protein